MYRYGLARSISLMTGAVLFLALVLAGCGGGGGGGGTGVSGASEGTGSSGTGVGSGSSGGSGSSSYTAVAIVSSGGVPVAGVPVTLSGSVDTNTQKPSGVITTQTTDAQGQASFPGLIKGMNYCFTVSFTDAKGNHQAAVCSNTGQTVIPLNL